MRDDPMTSGFGCHHMLTEAGIMISDSLAAARPQNVATNHRARGLKMASAAVDAIGATAAALTTLCWVPQAIKIIRDKETRAISLPGTTLCVLGILLWLIYGLAILDGPLIGSSVVTFAMTAVILALKIRHG
jgi:MtN3 and saliva related transmembrane protein